MQLNLTAPNSCIKSAISFSILFPSRGHFPCNFHALTWTLFSPSLSLFTILVYSIRVCTVFHIFFFSRCSLFTIFLRLFFLPNFLRAMAKSEERTKKSFFHSDNSVWIGNEKVGEETKAINTRNGVSTHTKKRQCQKFHFLMVRIICRARLMVTTQLHTDMYINTKYSARVVCIVFET